MTTRMNEILSRIARSTSTISSLTTPYRIAISVTSSTSTRSSSSETDSSSAVEFRLGQPSRSRPALAPLPIATPIAKTTSTFRLTGD